MAPFIDLQQITAYDFPFKYYETNIQFVPDWIADVSLGCQRLGSGRMVDERTDPLGANESPTGGRHARCAPSVRGTRRDARQCRVDGDGRNRLLLSDRGSISLC